MTRAVPLALALLAAACAGPSSLVGRTEADLRSRMGPPVAEYPNRDGSRTLAYPHGVMGSQTYMAEVEPGGSVRSVRQALNEETFQRIDPGMTRDETLRLIGPPGDSMAFPRKGEISWEYRFMDAWGYRAQFFVNFDARWVVVSKFTHRIDNSRDSRD
jgi:hypothetical protein